ncbi:Modulator of FtsH protease HflC [Suttonella ornithocola]|uniref:Protein HflC n=2 Tax=Suttonella ornithocola TaxID=279832 RepID=A0A380ML62_9GAMM|nr:Modulator of FtsH protease HflC [Suttonella ornithocola]
MKLKFPIIIVVALVLFFLAGSLYVLNERQVAVVTQFSRLVKTEENAGLKFKVPFLQQVEFFDKRIQRLNVDPELFLTNEKKYLIVDYYVEWRIGDIRRFYTSVQGNFQRASSLLDQLVKEGMRGEFARRSVSEVISEDRNSIMDTVTAEIGRDSARYGVEIIGVRLKRVDFSDDIRDRVFDRMRAERERVSKNLRAQGREKSQVIRANAEREAAEILAKANAESQVIRGRADAKAADIYAAAYGKDIEFYDFWRSMSAYKEGFKHNGDVLVVSPDDPFLKYFGKGDAVEVPTQPQAKTQSASLDNIQPQ